MRKEGLLLLHHFVTKVTKQPCQTPQKFAKPKEYYIRKTSNTVGDLNAWKYKYWQKVGKKYSLVQCLFYLKAILTITLELTTSKAVLFQTWNLSQNLHDRRFQGKKFTQKTRNFRHLLNCDKKCVNALNWDKTSKKPLFYQFIWAQHQ